MMPSLIQQATILIAQARMSNQLPVVFHMNAATMRMILDEQATAAQLRRSPLGRLIHRLRSERQPARLTSLHGVPVGENPTLPDGALYLATGQAQPFPMAGNLADAARQATAAPPMPQFQQRERIEPSEISEKPTLQELARNSEVTPTDILIRGMESIDDIRGIVVLRVFKNGNIDCSCNLSKFELQGVLQHGQMWAATHD